MSLSELARTFEMGVSGMGYSVERGEKLTQSNNFFKSVPLVGLFLNHSKKQEILLSTHTQQV